LIYERTPDLVCILDDAGKVVTTNRTARSVLGEDVGAFLTSARAKAFLEQLTSEGTATCVIGADDLNGTPRRVLLEGSSEGALRVVFVRDVSALGGLDSRARELRRTQMVGQLLATVVHDMSN